MISPPRQTTRERGEGGGHARFTSAEISEKNIKPFIDVDVFYKEKRLRALFQWGTFLPERMLRSQNEFAHDASD